MATDDIADRAAAFGMPGVIVDGFDFFAVHEAAGEAVARARDGGGPTLIEVKFTRYFGHFEGDQQLYRADEVANARANLDCLKRFRSRVTESGQLTDAQLDEVDAEVGLLIDASRRGRQGRPEAGRGRPAHRRLRLVLRRHHGTQHHLPRGDQRGAGPGDGARPVGHRHGRGQRGRPGLAGRGRTPGAASSASPRGSTTSSRAGCSTPRSRSRRSSGRPSAPRPAACGRWPS